MPELKFKRPDIILRDGKTSAFVLDIADYQALLEQIEDADDIAYLNDLYRQPLEFDWLEDLLKDRQAEYSHFLSD
ncbi:MAG: type II toxin-antitoxin system Phd/YefM family antitoxin [Calditrichaeota bacterium]|nr:type II toxin-antitoxin system Phd/YefM family antitoxin [Calditrichota bacterium]